MTFKTFLSIAAVAAVTQLTGCTLVPMTASIDVPVATTKVAADAPAVKIVSVTDSRKFVYPHEAGDCVTPSVDGEKMLRDEVTKARAYSRRGRCDGGEWANHAMVMVPEGQTIADSIREAIAVGFQNAGYRVESNSVESAIPVTVDVKNFWVSRQLAGMGVGYTIDYSITIDVDSSAIKVSDTFFDKNSWDSFLPHPPRYEEWSSNALQRIANSITAQLLPRRNP